VIWVTLALLLGLLALSVPVAAALAVVGLALDQLYSFLPLRLALGELAWGATSDVILVAIPLFVLLGEILLRAGIAERMYSAMTQWLSWLPGGLMHANIGACTLFAAVCGSSVATAATVGTVAIEQIERHGSNPRFFLGALAAGGTLGILIPPSIVLVVYAIIVEANIATLFAAAFIPGLLAMLFFVLTIALYVVISPEAGPKGERVAPAELRSATLAVLPVVVIFLLVIGGIYAGLFNPTPAAAIGVFLVAVYGLIRRKLSWNGSITALINTAKTTGMIYLILLGAELLNIFMSRGGVPQAAAEAAVTSGLSPYTILILLVVALLVLGCLMDSLSIILLAMPFFWPVISALDFGMPVESVKIWFGIIALVVVELGLITPPVGLNVFVINALAKDVPMSETFKGALPFFAAEIVRVTLIIAFPAIVLILPQLLAN
jgi:tripartite ATP-independent transporter DctM subunit